VHVPTRHARPLLKEKMHLVLRGRVGIAVMAPTAAPRRSPLRQAPRAHVRARRLHTTLQGDAVRRAWWCMRARAGRAPPVHHL